jgi:hypothetical protein
VAFHPRYPLQAATCFPTKTFDYIEARRPILVHAAADYAYTRYMCDHASAHIVSEFDPLALKNGVLELLSDSELQSQLVNNAVTLAQTHHHQGEIQKRFESYLFPETQDN